MHALLPRGNPLSLQGRTDAHHFGRSALGVKQAVHYGLVLHMGLLLLLAGVYPTIPAQVLVLINLLHYQLGPLPRAQDVLI